MFCFNNAAWLLLPLYTHWSVAQPFPSIAEVDLLFPRNDTYAPTPLMPLVFAIHNPTDAAALNLALEWALRYPAGANHLAVVSDGVITQSYSPTTTSNIYYMFSSLYNLTILEGAWELIWLLSSDNCTMFPPNGSSTVGYTQIKSIIFNTNNSAPATDLLAATTNDVCASAESFTFNITGIEKISLGAGAGMTTCAVVASTSPITTPTPNPCAAQLNAADASSISASLTASACGLPSSLVSCPARSVGVIQRRLRGSTWVIATFSWLLYTVVG
ncbi:hypothetical protein BGW36DRAFT_370020 [Talaromyces proteolyticus]|uniref:DUF7136 domain-containing protein n=1 Tax=Talaromyces proteolyticus TaxID=1131652 RepID=A0AAD4KYC5_9EURO|nr:uncharacterized protein BGW36DRAFT_370020 [Talaromyces proteolyticus]KAH8703811.1 hypothetical protein BGW36DRAFT_370020 [Talaromyces proteolyticus]